MESQQIRFKILFDILLGIEDGPDVESIMLKALRVLVRKLGCAAGVIFLPAARDGVSKFELAVSVPFYIKSNTILDQACHLVDGISPDEFIEDRLDPTLVHRRLGDRGSCYAMPLPRIGLLLLVKIGAELSEGLLKSLGPICRRLAGVCLARQMESRLQESTKRFHEMADNIQEVFWLFDYIAQRVVYASPAYETIWGRRVEDLYANYAEWGESIHPEDRIAAEESFSRAIASGEGAPREYRVVRPDGEVRWVSDRAFPIRDESGKVVRVTGIAEDITGRKKSEEEHRRFEVKMQHAQKLESLGVLAGGIAHDFNNLLLAILGNADLALMNLAPESPSREYVEKIETAAQRAGELTNQMLAYSGKGRFASQPIRLDLLIDELAHLLETVISKKATLKLDFAQDIPIIDADPSQIRQVVMNLITNASEALEGLVGSIVVRVFATGADHSDLSEYVFGQTCPEGSYVCLEVSDTGCGMERESQEKMFDPFFTTKFMGRGLGLAAVQGIVKGHHGAIKIESEPRRGCTVRVLFPVSKTMPDLVAEKVEKSIQIGAGSVVLVVDDDPRVLEVAAKMLEHQGFTVLTAADGREGVEMFREHAQKIALVVLDMTMPRLDGKEAFREILRIRSDARVILSSGYAQQEATCHFAEKGPAGFIQKPYRLKELVEKVSEALGQP